MMPALLTSTEIGSISACTLAARTSQAVRSVTSQARPTAFSPTARATRTAAPILMSMATIRAPSRAVAIEIASPIPEPAPVTSAVHPTSKPDMRTSQTTLSRAAREGAKRSEAGSKGSALDDPSPMACSGAMPPRDAGDGSQSHRLLLGAQCAAFGDCRGLRRLQRILGPSARTDRVGQAPDPLVAAPDVIAVGLRRVAVDQGPRIERMRHAADFVLNLEQHLTGFEIDDVLEPVLAAVALLGNQIVLSEFLVRRAEILDIDL